MCNAVKEVSWKVLWLRKEFSQIWDCLHSAGKDHTWSILHKGPSWNKLQILWLISPRKVCPRSKAWFGNLTSLKPVVSTHTHTTHHTHTHTHTQTHTHTHTHTVNNPLMSFKIVIACLYVCFVSDLPEDCWLAAFLVPDWLYSWLSV